jgi:hypothetical protein
MFKRKNKKNIFSLDERLADFLFGRHQGYTWAHKLDDDSRLRYLLLQQGGFVDVRIESRLLYDEYVPFSIFNTPDCEFSFNQPIWQNGNLLNCYKQTAQVFLFLNRQRLMTVSLARYPHILRHHCILSKQRVQQSQTHWTNTNAWLMDYLDFIRRLEHMMQQLPQAPSRMDLLASSNAFYSLFYRLGYGVGKWIYKS